MRINPVSSNQNFGMIKSIAYSSRAERDRQYQKYKDKYGVVKNLDDIILSTEDGKVIAKGNRDSYNTIVEIDGDDAARFIGAIQKGFVRKAVMNALKDLIGNYENDPKAEKLGYSSNSDKLWVLG